MKFKIMLKKAPTPEDMIKYFILFSKYEATLRFVNNPKKKYDNKINGSMTSPDQYFSSSKEKLPNFNSTRSGPNKAIKRKTTIET